MKVRINNSSGKKTHSAVSPNLVDSSMRCSSGNSLISPNVNVQSRSKNGIIKDAAPSVGGRATEMISPVSRVILSTQPLTMLLEPEGETNIANTLVCSENNLLTRSHPSLKEMALSFIEKDLGVGYAYLFAMMNNLNYYGPVKSTPDPITTPDEKMRAFTTGLRKVLNCSKAQLDNALEYEKKMNAGKPKRGPKPKTSALGRASSSKD